MADCAETHPRLAGRLDAGRLDLLLRGLEDLGCPVEVATSLLELTAEGSDGPLSVEQRLAEAVRILRLDPALAARVLSAAAAEADGEVLCVERAAGLLGLERVRALALAAGTRAETTAAEELLAPAALVRHSLAVASGTVLLAREAALAVAEGTAFTAGLLHDIGKLALAALAPKSYARALALAARRKCPPAEAEREVLGVDHLQAGRRLARQWRLAGVYERVIWLHHQPAGAIPSPRSDERLIRLVGLADAIARRMRIGASGNLCATPQPEELAGPLGLSAETVEEVGGRLIEIVERHARVLRLEQAECQVFCARALVDAKTELCRLNDQLRRRAADLAAEAEAFRRFRRFAAGLTGEAEVPDVLLQAARVLSGGGSEGSQPAVCYSLDEAAGTLLAVCAAPGGEASWRRYELSGPPDGTAASGPAPARSVRLPIRVEGDPWLGWIPPDRYVHRPLVCGGRWVGGVLVSAERSDEAGSALADAMALAVALAQRRSEAAATTEELAGASRRVAAERDSEVEAKALAVVEDLATGAAHELNNPLTVMSGRAQLMRDKARSRRQREVWQTIVDQSQRISDLISELMAFARPPEPVPEAVGPRELLAEAAKTFAGSDHPQAGTCRVDIEVGDDVPAIWADREQMLAVVVELITNAATAASRPVRVRLSAEADDAGRTVVLTVADDGPGMDEQTLRRVYTPFFSSQPAGRRPGLGLPKARRMVEKNAGRMWLDSEPGRGTVISIRLPAVQ